MRGRASYDGARGSSRLVRLSVLAKGPLAATISPEMSASVLIVDDHPSFRASARMLLEAEGFDVVGEAPDGQSALTAVRELRPDVVLLDVHLPDIEGPEVAARLEANGARTVIVLCSSRALEDLGALSGVRGFIPKSELSGAALEALL
jgi:DNA-binding NarL/FixJ family response regulator